MNIVYAFSSDWFDKWKISCFSLFCNNKDTEITVYLLGVKLNENQKEEVNILLSKFNSKKIIILDINDNDFSNLNNTQEYTKYALYRLLIPNLIQEERALYLDVDTIILQDINEFYNININNIYIAGVEDTYIQEDVLKSINFIKDDRYINSGVLLFNLNLIREDKINELMMKLVNTKKFIYPDQTIINLCCKDKRLIITPEYNYSYFTMRARPLLKEQIKILHVAGPKNRSWFIKMPYIELWKTWELEWNKQISNSVKNFEWKI